MGETGTIGGRAGRAGRRWGAVAAALGLGALGGAAEAQSPAPVAHRPAPVEYGPAAIAQGSEHATPGGAALAVGLSDARLWTAAAPPAVPRRTVSGRPPARQERAGPRGGSEFWIPFGSLFLPGLGQYLQGAVPTGLALSAVALGGALAAGDGSTDLETIPRDPGDQFDFEAVHVVFTAGALSAWDAFGRPRGLLQDVGKYESLPAEQESIGDLLTAPFDFRFLGRWTTLVDLAFTGAVAGVVLSQREDGRDYLPFEAHDAAFVGALSFNAAVSEEALFRGWLLPMLQEKVGDRFWLANGIQATIFGLGHLPQAEGFALVIAGAGLYSGWLTRRNDWSVREAIFQHFWYDVIVATAELLTDEARPVALLPFRITF